MPKPNPGYSWNIFHYFRIKKANKISLGTLAPNPETPRKGSADSYHGQWRRTSLDKAHVPRRSLKKRHSILISQNSVGLNSTSGSSTGPSGYNTPDRKFLQAEDLITDSVDSLSPFAAMPRRISGDIDTSLTPLRPRFSRGISIDSQTSNIPSRRMSRRQSLIEAHRGSHSRDSSRDSIL